MHVDAAALARALHSSSASLEEKLDAARALCDVVFAQDHQEDTLPDLLRAHYAASLLDWLLSAIGRSGGGAAAVSGNQRQKKKKGKAAEENAPAPASPPRKELWKMLTMALQHPIVSPERPLPASLVPAATAALHPDATPADLYAVSQLLGLLSTKFSGSFKPALDPTAALVAAALACCHRSPTAAAAALDLMLPLLQHHPNPRKAWDAVVPRLTEPLVDAAFGGKGDDGGSVSGTCKAILTAAVFSQAHVAALSEASVANSDAETTKNYAAQLFKGLESVVAGAAAGGENAERKLEFLPWAVGQYCTAFAEHKRAAEIAAAIAKPTFGAGSGGGEQDKPSEARTVAGVPIDADFRFFSAVAAIVERHLGSNGAEASSVSVLLRCLAGVCAALKSHHIYRPTEDPSGAHRERLAGVVACAAGLGAAAPSVADAALRVLQAVLAVEHRGVQAHLPALWPMLWAPVATGTSTAQPTVAAALVQAYSELRQLEVLLSSLSDAIIALNTTAASAAADLLAGAAFRSALATAVRSAPSGQAAPLVRAVAGWVPRLDTAPAPLVLADLGCCVLGAVAADVTTAPAVATAAAQLVTALGPALIPELRKMLGRKKNGALDKVAACLALYRLALRLHARCCLLHPEVLSLAGQEVHPLKNDNSGPSGGYFDALDGGAAVDAGAAWCLAGGVAACPPALQAALLGAAAQRLETLNYRRLHALHACGGAADDSEEDGGSQTAVWRQRRAAAPAIESEMAEIGALLAENAGKRGETGISEALSLATAATVSAAACALALNCASLAGVADVLTHEGLENVVSAALEVAMDAESGSDEAQSAAARAALATPAAAAALPLVVAKRAHALLRDLAAELPGSGERKKKKVKTPEGKAKSASGPLEALIKCVKHASKGNLDGEELSQAMEAAAEGLEAAGSSGDAATAAAFKPGKRKRETAAAVADDAHELKDLNRLLDALLRLDLRPLQPTGAKALAVTGLATAAAAVASGTGTNVANGVSEALKIVAAAAPLPLEACGGVPRFLAALGAAATVPLAPASFKLIAQQAFQACLKASSDESGPGAAVKAWLDGALAAPTPASRLVVIEGVLAASREVMAPMNAFHASDDAEEGAAVRKSANPEAVSLASSLISTFETRSPALATLSETAALGPAAACAAHALAVRCWAPADAQMGLPEPCPLLLRLSEDVSAVAAALNSAIKSSAEASTDLLRYLQAVSAVTCSMKPAAPLEHYASLVCLLLHVLRLLPAPADALDPVRRTIPLTAAFPAARTAMEDASMAREAALNALRVLLAVSSSERLRHVLAFAEVVLTGTGSAAVALQYRLPVTELTLMALEGCKGKAALRTLGQRAERLAAALTAAVTRTACPLAATYTSVASFGDLYAAFCAAEKSEGAVSAPTVAWTAALLSPLPESEAAVSVATALRALESIAARPKALPLSGRHVARELHAVAAAAAAQEVSGAATPASAAAFVNACHLLMALARHREAELGRCMPLAVSALRALLTTLVRWEAAAAVGSGAAGAPKNKGLAHRVYCAEALAAAMAEIAAVKASEKYCPHILADYLILAACPATPASLAALGLGGGGGAAVPGRPAALLCGPGVAAALRQGAYAVYGACGAGGVQYVYASLGARGGGGLWRAGLAALKIDHDKSFKYTGKV